MATLAPSKSGRKARGDGHLRRGEILAAARRIFLEQGYDRATIRRIADEVGVSSTALYLHFRDKSEILLEICREVFTSIDARHAEIQARGLEPAERVRLMLDAYLDFALGAPDAYWLVFVCRPGDQMDAEAGDAAQELGRACYARFEAVLAELSDAGRLSDTPRAATQALWAAVHGLASLLIAKPDFDWAPQAELRAALLDRLFAGLLTGDAGSSTGGA